MRAALWTTASTLPCSVMSHSLLFPCVNFLAWLAARRAAGALGIIAPHQIANRHHDVLYDLHRRLDTHASVAGVGELRVVYCDATHHTIVVHGDMDQLLPRSRLFEAHDLVDLVVVRVDKQCEAVVAAHQVGEGVDKFFLDGVEGDRGHC